MSFLFVWNRRGRFSFSKQETNSIQENLGIKNNSFYNHIANEGETLKDYVAYCLSQKFHIDNSRCYSINKMMVLDIAKQIGLRIPNTLITNNYENIKHETDDLITKGIQGVIHFSGYNASHLHQRTQIVEKETLEQAPNFFYSLFQQKIEKNTKYAHLYFLTNCFLWQFFLKTTKRLKLISETMILKNQIEWCLTNSQTILKVNFYCS